MLERIDKTVFTIHELNDESNDLNFWLSKTPQERISAIELLRRIYYGKDACAQRLDRVFEIVERTQNIVDFKGKP